MIITYYTIAQNEQDALMNLDNSRNAPLSTSKGVILNAKRILDENTVK